MKTIFRLNDKAISDAMIKLNLNQKRFAEALRMPLQNLQKILKRGTIRIDTLGRLSKVLNVDAWDLVVPEDRP